MSGRYISDLPSVLERSVWGVRMGFSRLAGQQLAAKGRSHIGVASLHQGEAPLPSDFVA